jgi:1-acyl-sn-glycerol-3-phosphate acyltransferase
VVARRLLTIPLYLGLTLVLTALAPALLILSWLMSLLPACRGAVPTFAFILGYLWCETSGIVASFFIWLRHRDRDRFLAANYALQYWWAHKLKEIAEIVFGLQFSLTGEEALEGDGAIVLARHASMADTIIPMEFYAIPLRIRLRYVLKKELLLDPCLDIVGNRLPNYFVDRGGEDTERAIAGVADLVREMDADEGVLLYPEGRRFTPARAAALRERWADQPEMLAQLDRWTHLLPPRLGGTLALLTHNPGRDVIFCAHSGFEGSSHFSNLINGSWRGARIRIHFWRVSFNDLPEEPEALRSFLFAQWDQVDHWVSLLSSDTGEGDPQ